MSTQSWKFSYWTLFVIWVGCAILDMRHAHLGLLTSYGADLSLPAWLYIAFRGLDNPLRRTRPWMYLGRSSEATASLLVVGSTLTEVSQYFWPHGLFAGTFDPLDILAYALSVGICYGLDKRSTKKLEIQGAGAIR